MKTPAFQFYPGDFLAGRVATYSLDEIGAYSLLLAFDWSLNGLPADVETIARLCRVSPRKMRALWSTIGEQFPERDGRRYNPRLEIERAKQEARRASLKANGKLGGRPSKSKSFPEGKQDESLSSSSSISSPALAEVQQHDTPRAREEDEQPEQIAWQTLRGMCSEEELADIRRFLRGRRAEEGWLREMARLLGAGGNLTSADLAAACRDALLLDRRLESPRALRAFVASSRDERLKAAGPSPNAGPARETGEQRRIAEAREKTQLDRRAQLDRQYEQERDRAIEEGPLPTEAQVTEIAAKVRAVGSGTGQFAELARAAVLKSERARLAGFPDQDTWLAKRERRAS